ncbi:MAG: SIS domain-containing protein, partial [Nanoarchaeota archaeon]
MNKRLVLERILKESIQAINQIPFDLIDQACNKIIDCYINGRKLLICGNGGSAADSQHMAGEFVNRFLIERRPYRALSLTTDTSILTSVGNDYSFDEVFSKQVEAYGDKDDVLFVMSTSGNSKNIIRAVQVA